VSPVRLEVWSDYLCPWCHLGAHRLALLEAEGGVELCFRSFLLRPHPRADRDLHAFVRYTQSWTRPAAEPDAPAFRVWETSEGPPSHSVPPHLVAKAARALHPQRARALHERLLRAYFAENRDISREVVLRELWVEVGFVEADFASASDPAVLRETIDDHNQAVELGITGVPAVRAAGSDAFVLGAQPLAVYRRWVSRLRERAESPA
jgi:predicted DsbA family dithiol-disulfide isomerase